MAHIFDEYIFKGASVKAFERKLAVFYKNDFFHLMNSVIYFILFIIDF